MSTVKFWDHIVAETGFHRDAVKHIVFCLVFGSLGNKTLFDVAREYKFDISDIIAIRCAADDWLKF